MRAIFPVQVYELAVYQLAVYQLAVTIHAPGSLSASFPKSLCVRTNVPQVDTHTPKALCVDPWIRSCAPVPGFDAFDLLLHA